MRVLSYRLRYTGHAKSNLTKLMIDAEDADPFERGVMQKKFMSRERLSLYHINFCKAVALVRLGLLHTQSPIHLSDMFR